MKELIVVVFFASAFLLQGAVGVAECMSGNPIRCYECNSHETPLCADPFNWTSPPPIKRCNGCCLKMVQGIGTPDQKVRRGCTDDIDINLFMVDHVCMTEGGGKGKMCFCEENECNSAQRHFQLNAYSLLNLLLCSVTFKVILYKLLY